MCYPVCGMVHIKELLLLIGKPFPDRGTAGTCARDRRALQQLALNVHVKHGKSSPCSGGTGFPFSLSITKCVECVVK